MASANGRPRLIDIQTDIGDQFAPFDCSPAMKSTNSCGVMLYAAFLLPRALARFQASYPNVDVTVHCALSREVAEMMEWR